MAIERVVNVLDHAPADLTPAEVLLLVALAELARANEWTVPMATLCRRTRLTPDGVRRALRRLAERGIEVRVPLGKDRRGQPLYAVPGVAPRYRVPTFPPPEGCDCSECAKAQVTEGGTAVPPSLSSGNAQVSEGKTGVFPSTDSLRPGQVEGKTGVLAAKTTVRAAKTGVRAAKTGVPGRQDHSLASSVRKPVRRKDGSGAGAPRSAKAPRGDRAEKQEQTLADARRRIAAAMPFPGPGADDAAALIVEYLYLSDGYTASGVAGMANSIEQNPSWLAEYSKKARAWAHAGKPITVEDDESPPARRRATGVDQATGEDDRGAEAKAALAEVRAKLSRKRE